MKIFDFETAQVELAIPAWNALPDSTKELVFMVIKAVEHLPQEQGTLLVRFPTEEDEEAAGIPRGEIARRIGYLSSRDIALAAEIAHNVCHWASGKDQVEELKGLGRKFSQVATRFLHRRMSELGLSVSLTSSGHRDVVVYIYEGVIRVGFSGKDFWMFRKIGLTSEFLLAKVIRLIESSGAGFGMTYEFAKNTLDQLELLMPDEDKPILKTERFMVEEEEIKKRRMARAAAKPDHQHALPRFATIVDNVFCLKDDTNPRLEGKGVLTIEVKCQSCGAMARFQVAEDQLKFDKEE